MAIVNHKCLECEKNQVCKWADLIEKFSEDKKNPVGVEIEIKNCIEFQEA